jgi:hypothetical protein
MKLQNFFEWFTAQYCRNENPWLIIGKGPSYADLSSFDTNSFNKVSLNHVVRDQKVAIAHIIDFDVAIECARNIDENAEVLVMPWRPHIDNWVSIKTLDELLEGNSILKKIKDEGRVKFYNLGSCTSPADASSIIPTNYFSSEAVVNLLTIGGVKKIRTIGIDGGTSYSTTFKDLSDKTLLNNGHQSFDIQFRSIAKKIMMEKLDYAPLNIDSPVKVYVGSMPEQMLAVRVLEYSIKKNASMPVEVFPLFKAKIDYPMPKDAKNKPRTPFSFQRFLIPKLNQHKGKAIYVDSDMQVFVDIKDLWSRNMNGTQLMSAFESTGASGRKPQFSVMLMDCENLNWEIHEIVKKLDRGELNYEQLMYEMKVADRIDPVIEREWNSLEFYEEGKTKLLHFTDMNRQPWLYTHNPLTKIWVRELADAVKSNFITLSEIKNEIVGGNVRPSLWIQIKKKIFTPDASGTRKLKSVDRFFIPPHARTPSASKMKLRLNKILARIIVTLV